jgi:mercuric ion binding protein
MKKLIISSAIIMAAFASQGQSKVKVQTDTFKVWGNCSMCEKKIEKAASKVKGVTKADWDKETKILTLTYNPLETNVENVQKAIAAVGYDSKNIKATDKAYNNLDGCCQYEREK